MSPSRDEPRAEGESHEAAARSESVDLVVRYQEERESSRGSEALNRLFKLYQDRIRRVVRMRMGQGLRCRLESDDIVQDTVHVALRKLAELDTTQGASLLDWFSKIATFRIQESRCHHFAQKRDMQRETSMGRIYSREDQGRLDDLDIESRETGPEDAACNAEIQALLDESLDRLSRDHREVIVQRDYFGLDWAAVAEALGRKGEVPAVQQLHQRAWAKLLRLARPRLRDVHDA